MLARADSALYFLNHALTFLGMKADDIAWQRSILMMISYSFELITKSEIVFTSQNVKVDDIDRELRGLGHNMQQIICELQKRGSLRLMNIIDFKVDNNGSFTKYVIYFNDKNKLIVEDFVDIRYDYTKTFLRKVISHNIIIGYINKMIELSKNVKTRQESKSHNKR